MFTNPPSLRKKLLADPIQYKRILGDYIKAGAVNRGELATRKPAPGADTSKRDLPKFRITEGDVHAAWQRAVDKYTELSNNQKLSIKHVNAELKTVPLDLRPAVLAGTLASLAGVALSNLPGFIKMFVWMTICGGVKVAVGLFLLICEIALSVAFLGGFSKFDFGSGDWFGSVSDCKNGGGRRRRVGGEDKGATLMNAAKAAYNTNEEAKLDPNDPNNQTGLYDALEEAAKENVALRKDFDRLLREAIEATQIIYGDEKRLTKSLLADINSLPTFPPIAVDAPADKAAAAAIAFAIKKKAENTTATGAPVDPGSAPAQDLKDPEDEKIAKAAVEALKQEADDPSAAAAADSKAEAEAQPAPESAAAPEAPLAAAPEAAAAPATDCWTKRSDETDTWFENGKESVWELPAGATECSAGGRRRRTRGGDKPQVPKPPPATAGRRKTRRTLRGPFRKSTRGRRR